MNRFLSYMKSGNFEEIKLLSPYDLISDNLKDHDSRHLMVITDN
jgi:hypothetical protein